MANDIWTIFLKMYEIKNTSTTLYLKKKILSINMEENESLSSFVSRIKEVKDELIDIVENVSNGDLVMITMNDMMEDYQMFIMGLNAREKPHSFEEITKILLQEEERRLSLKPQNLDLALRMKFKPKGKAMADYKKGSVSRKRTPQGMASHKRDFSPKCFYCGKRGHIAKFFHKKKVDEERYKQKRHVDHLADADENQDVRLFIGETALATEEDE